MRGLVLILITLFVSPALHAARLTSGDDDVCSLRPDLCDPGASTKARAKRVRTAGARRVVRRGLDATSAPLASVIPSTTATKAEARARSITCRPSHVEITGANENLPECGSGRGPAGAASATTPNFNDYLVQNARNPALSTRIADYQTAFKDTARPATLDLTSLTDGASAAPRDGAAAANGANGQARVNQ